VDTSLKTLDADVTGNLTSGPIQSSGPVAGTAFTAAGTQAAGGSLTLSNGTNNVTLTNTGNSTLSTTGTISAGNLITAGTFSASSLATTGSLTAGSIVDNGTLQTQSVAAAGTVQAQTFTAIGTVTAANLKVTGAVDFTNATLTGLNLSQVLGGGTLPILAVGASTATTAPLTVTENNKTVQIGVDTSGNLTVASESVGNLTVTGTLTASQGLTFSNGITVPGTTQATGITASRITGTPATNTTTPGALTITSSALTLNGPTTQNGDLTLGNTSDLVFSTNGSSAASHIESATDSDVAGLTGPVTVPTSTSVATVTQSFTTAYANAPYVVVTPETQPEKNGATDVTYWVTSTTTGFTIHVVAGGAPASTYSLPFYYHVIGQ
jgi:filamentous hemagglutinin